jgi:hypothetical protein
MSKDITGILRIAEGFNKIPNKYGNQLVAVEYLLRPIDLDLLRSIFNVSKNDPDPGVRDMMYCYEIDEERAKLLQPYVIEGEIDLSKYDFYLSCMQDPEYREYWDKHWKEIGYCPPPC